MKGLINGRDFNQNFRACFHFHDIVFGNIHFDREVVIVDDLYLGPGSAHSGEKLARFYVYNFSNAALIRIYEVRIELFFLERYLVF